MFSIILALHFNDSESVKLSFESYLLYCKNLLNALALLFQYSFILLSTYLSACLAASSAPAPVTVIAPFTSMYPSL